MAFKRRPAADRKRRKSRRTTETVRTRGGAVATEDIDYKNIPLLLRVVSAQGKAFSRKRTGFTAEQQRKLAVALKRARFLALMPYVT